MQSPERPAKRGRPRTITREKICEAGMQLGLPNITFVGVAAALGVSHMALYKHVANLQELKLLVAQEMFNQWQLPQASQAHHMPLKDYLVAFTQAVREFIKAHPGLTPYVIRRAAATESMIEKILSHQRHIAQAYGLGQEQSRWLVATVAFHCMAVADTVYTVASREPMTGADRAVEEKEMEEELNQGMQALIVGALAMLDAGYLPSAAALGAQS
ncbi:TetR/AcrR family transcriptional regulator [Lampropedia puyangensis]|uniref:TetR/AcrR family transcriptional regulator n=1 Tax=Lampropedia puyangensis TaxID=1330072 RepID=A0A4S8FBV2_9BURK|nr:TetR/AcrR family transcriptional regulator [Lampropedia puyangensis]THU05123.1 TetR/AcrR family transcriptional regulator [Lampropedia puyangensis]